MELGSSLKMLIANCDRQRLLRAPDRRALFEHHFSLGSYLLAVRRDRHKKSCCSASSALGIIKQ
eukprot:scaffold584_cov132-Cylindrotheca_fusiformis.AAC.7